jgi:hypothetical protein
MPVTYQSPMANSHQVELARESVLARPNQGHPAIGTSESCLKAPEGT